MNILNALLLFALFIIAYIIIVEVFTVLFRLTGITEEKAKLQVISMLTNSGFTTAESEVVIKTKLRRKLTRITILFGYSFTVIIVSIIVNVVLALNQAAFFNLLLSAAAISLLLILLLSIIRLRWVKAAFDRMIERLANRLMFGSSSNALILIETYGDNVMAEIHLQNIPKEIEDIPLKDSNLKESYGIQILLVKQGGSPIDVINGDTVIHQGETVVVFGGYKNIRMLFENPMR